MKYINFIYSLMGLMASFILASCDMQSSKKYSLSLDRNNLYITMPHPTIDAANFNKVNWQGVNLSSVVQDTYKMLQDGSANGECTLYVNFETDQTDQYGNPIKNSDKKLLTSIPLNEARRFQSSKFLDESYMISEKIYRAAFNIPTLNIVNDSIGAIIDIDSPIEVYTEPLVGPYGGIDLDYASNKYLITVSEWKERDYGLSSWKFNSDGTGLFIEEGLSNVSQKKFTWDMVRADYSITIYMDGEHIKLSNQNNEQLVLEDEHLGNIIYTSKE